MSMAAEHEHNDRMKSRLSSAKPKTKRNSIDALAGIFGLSYKKAMKIMVMMMMLTIIIDLIARVSIIVVLVKVLITAL